MTDYVETQLEYESELGSEFFMMTERSDQGTQQNLEVIQNIPLLYIEKFLLTDEQVLNLASILTEDNCVIQTLSVERNTLGSKYLKSFCEALKSNISLKHVVFNQVEVIGEDLDIVFDALKTHPQLETIKLLSMKMDNESCEHLVALLKISKGLKVLHIEQCELGDQQLATIASGLKANQSLEVLNLERNAFGPASLCVVLQALTPSAQLQTLALREFALSPSLCTHFHSLLAAPQSPLRRLHLAALKTPPPGDLSALLQAVGQAGGLQRLELADVAFAGAAYGALVAVPGRLGALRQLALRKCHLGRDREQFKGLVQAVRGKGLTSLDLSDNALGEAGARALQAYLEGDRVLEALNVAGNAIGQPGAACIAAGIAHHRVITKLDISRNKIPSGGFNAFTKIIKSNKSLTELSVAGNLLLGYGIIEFFKTSLPLNAKLQKLDFSSNLIEQKCGEMILLALKTNFSVKYFDISNNTSVQQEHREQILKECETNRMIEKEIVSKLPKKTQFDQNDNLEDENSSIGKTTEQVSAKDINITDQNLATVQQTDQQFLPSKQAKTEDKLDFKNDSLEQAGIGKPLMLKESNSFLPKDNGNNSLLSILPTNQNQYVNESRQGRKTIVTGQPSFCHVKSLNELYDIRVVVLENIKVEDSSFIAKFIRIHHRDINQLTLRDVTFKDNMDHLIDVLTEHRPLLKMIQFESVQIGSSLINKLVHAVEMCEHIKQLSFVNVNRQFKNNELASGLYMLRTHLMLNQLDLSNNSFSKEEHEQIVDYLSKAKHIKQVSLRDVYLSEEVIHLYLDLVSHHKNVNKIEYNNHQGHIPRDLKDKLDRELHLNFHIHLMEQTPGSFISHKHKGEVNFSNRFVKEIDALIKYLKIFWNSKILILNNCKLTDDHLEKLLAFLSISGVEIRRLSLSENKLTEKSCELLSEYIGERDTFEDLSLSHNKVGLAGLEMITALLKIKTSIKNLAFVNCGIETEDKKPNFIEDIKNNATCHKLDLQKNKIPSEVKEIVDAETRINAGVVEHIVPFYAQKIKDISLVDDEELLSILSPSRRRAGLGQNSTSSIGNQKLNINFELKLSKALTFMEATKSVAEKQLAGKNKRQRRASKFLESGLKTQAQKLAPQRSLLIQKSHTVLNGNLPSELSEVISHSQMSVTSGRPDYTIFIKAKNLQSLDFLEKFLRVFPQFTGVNIEDIGISHQVIKQFAEQVKNNSSLCYFRIGHRKNIGGAGMALIYEQLQLNKQIEKFVIPNFRTENGKQILKLNNMSLKELKFIVKFVQENRQLKVLDLSRNSLGDDCANEIQAILKEAGSIEQLDLSNNQLSPNGLQKLCSVLAEPGCTLTELNVSNNSIPDFALKILLACLYQNTSLIKITYTVTEVGNLQKLQDYKQVEKMPLVKINKWLRRELNDEVELKLWHKILFPVWCWKTLIHAKHEAFRFKYETTKLNLIDQSIGWVAKTLYVNTLVYYLLSVGAPFTYVEHCGSGINSASHFWYIGYSIINLCCELAFVITIQRKLKDIYLLEINRWHIIELIMGQIARFDYYTDICFFVMLLQCDEVYLYWPVGIFLLLMQIYPVKELFKLLKTNKNLQHTLPEIERCCKLSFIRENMFIAVVLDSFCINNYENIFGFQVCFPKTIGMNTFFFQDMPQMLIHMYFLFFYFSYKIAHDDLTVVISLISSIFAIQISLFNVIVSKPNYFDPRLLEIELRRKREMREQEESTQVQEFQKTVSRGRTIKRAKSTVLGQDPIAIREVAESMEASFKKRRASRKFEKGHFNLVRKSIIRHKTQNEQQGALVTPMSPSSPDSPNLEIHVLSRDSKQENHRQESEEEKVRVQVKLQGDDDDYFGDGPKKEADDDDYFFGSSQNKSRLRSSKSFGVQKSALKKQGRRAGMMDNRL